MHAYHEKLCLVQLSFDGNDAVIDPLALRGEELAPLASLLADHEVVKVMHGADYDLRMLDRDLGAHLCSLEDTQVAAQLVGEGSFGLAVLVGKELGVVLDKKYQRSDWSIRPLGGEELRYAAADTAFLAGLMARMGERLDDLGRREWWQEECRVLESIRWEPSTGHNLGFERLRGVRALTGAARDRVAALWQWREDTAEAADVPPFRVMSPDTVVDLAVNPPADVAALASRRGVGRAVCQRSGARIVALLTAPPPVPPRVHGERFVRDRELETRVKELKASRDLVAASLAIDPALLAPRAALEAVARDAPRDHDGLVASLGRHWRAGVLAAEVLPVVAHWPRVGAVHDEPSQ